jgi:hypothetical protein
MMVVIPGRCHSRLLCHSRSSSGGVARGGTINGVERSWVGLFGPWGGSSRPYHTPWSCWRSWSTQIVGCGHTETDSLVWCGLVWSGGVWYRGVVGVGGWGGSGCGGW